MRGQTECRHSAFKPRFADVNAFMNKIYQSASPVRTSDAGKASLDEKDDQPYPYVTRQRRSGSAPIPTLSQVERCLAFGGLDDDEDDFPRQCSPDSFSALTCVARASPTSDVLEMMEVKWSGHNTNKTVRKYHSAKSYLQNH
ncbi:hypothetical protein CYMTET_20406 [Cymbomonas tetramitiformis]|uniref:Uncharacterized protein n=1 Tax=Cymbomonas tetramitiformis TaxID=36881 RepID=A0AAE0L496_9CHLO|nr:hypothetical protein CYMTET_20406 [Cymbomonas tetramitiformis]